VDDVENGLDLHADIVVIVSPDAPLPSQEHLAEAIDTLMLQDVDQVVSTSEVEELLLRHGSRGMERINPGVTLGLRVEHDAVFAANGSIHAVWRDALRRRGLYEGRIGQIVMTRTERLGENR
jgi:CMP-N-acetylneuraminic acid synthetase